LSLVAVVAVTAYGCGAVWQSLTDRLGGANGAGERRPTEAVAISSLPKYTSDVAGKAWFRRYFARMVFDDGNGAGGAGFARSKDGIHWEKPILDLVESHGNRHNNLVVVKGDPSKKIEDIEQVVTVFKDGLGYDSARLIESVRGHVGIR
jgi:hypothetical protein